MFHYKIVRNVRYGYHKVIHKIVKLRIQNNIAPNDKGLVSPYKIINNTDFFYLLDQF